MSHHQREYNKLMSALGSTESQEILLDFMESLNLIDVHKHLTGKFLADHPHVVLVNDCLSTSSINSSDSSSDLPPK